MSLDLPSVLFLLAALALMITAGLSYAVHKASADSEKLEAEELTEKD